MSIKKQLKSKIRDVKNTGPMPTEDDIMSVVQSKKYVSFDIFDTLLKRNVKQPTDVFKLMELILSKRGLPFSATKRIEAEKKARSKTLAEEITIEDIYQQYVGLSSPERTSYVETELDVEDSVLVPNQVMVNVYNRCVELGKHVFVISDMYLPHEFLEKLLFKNGIKGYEKLYVSCEVGKTKKEGTLFEEYLTENNIAPKQAIHIGDSWKSDFASPRKLGMDAVHIPLMVKEASTIYDDNNLKTNYLNQFVNNTVDNSKGVYYQFGYQKFGPFLWGYANWLHNRAQKKYLSKLYFFSRDGFIMKKAYDLLFVNDKVRSYYLEVSRRSLRVPILWLDASFETILGMVSPSKRVSLRSLFDCVGLAIEDYEQLLSKYNFTERTSFDRNKIKEDKNLQSLFMDLNQDIVNLSKREYATMIQYLEQRDVKGNFGIVDIGWSGGMQRFLSKTLDQLKIPHQIYGHYIGVADYYKRNIHGVDLDMEGYLFDFKNKKNEKDKRSSFVGLFETLFLEQGGSVKNYSVSATGEVKANRYPYEYIVNGQETFEYKRVKELQLGALEFIRSAKEDRWLNQFAFTADELYEGLRQTGQEPNKNDLKMFANFKFYDEGEQEALANPKSMLYYTFHPKILKNDFLESRWKIGFLKKLMKLNINYEYIYNILLKFK